MMSLGMVMLHHRGLSDMRGAVDFLPERDQQSHGLGQRAGGGTGVTAERVAGERWKCRGSGKVTPEYGIPSICPHGMFPPRRCAVEAVVRLLEEQNWRCVLRDGFKKGRNGYFCSGGSQKPRTCDDLRKIG